MAAAHVTGAAVIALAKDPTASPQEVAQHISGEARDVVTAVPGATTGAALWTGAVAAAGLLHHWEFEANAYDAVGDAEGSLGVNFEGNPGAGSKPETA